MSRPHHPGISGLFAAGCLATVACGESAGEEACDTFVDTYVTKAADECGLGTREAVRESLFAGFSMLGIESCADVDSVRDESSFYDDCIPWIESATCEQLTMSDSLPESCRGQLQIER